MILTDEKRRWIEIRFFYFCYDVYQLNHDMIDVINTIELMNSLGDFDLKLVKKASGKVLGMQSNLPTKEEIICLAVKNGIKQRALCKTLEMKPSTVSVIANTKSEIYEYCPPRLDIDEDTNILKFLDIWENFQKVGLTLCS
jgi:hypothetical protein